MLTTVICASLLGMLGDTFVHGSVFSIGGPGALVFWAFAVMVLKETGRLRRGEAAPGDVVLAAPPRPHSTFYAPAVP
jgi:hypothetical protein